MNNIPIDKVPLSVSNPELVESMRIEAEKKTAEMKKKGMVTILAKASIVPIGLYAFSKYNKYDTKKTIKVTIIGSVVILGALVINELSGWSSPSQKFSNRIFGFNQIKSVNNQRVLKQISVENMPQLVQGTPEEQKALHDSLIKSMPDNFTLKLSADSNVNYYRNSNNEFYKQPYSTTGFSGVPPIKISLAEYSDAYVKFKNK